MGFRFENPTIRPRKSSGSCFGQCTLIKPMACRGAGGCPGGGGRGCQGERAGPNVIRLRAAAGWFQQSRMRVPLFVDLVNDQAVENGPPASRPGFLRAPREASGQRPLGTAGDQRPARYCTEGGFGQDIGVANVDRSMAPWTSGEILCLIQC